MSTVSYYISSVLSSYSALSFLLFLSLLMLFWLLMLDGCGCNSDGETETGGDAEMPVAASMRTSCHKRTTEPFICRRTSKNVEADDAGK